MRGRKNKNQFIKRISFIIKTLFIIDMLIFACSFIVTSKYLYDLLGFSFLIVTIIALSLLFKYPSALEVPKVKANIFNLDFKNYNDFISYLDNNVSTIKYKKYDLNDYNNFVIYYLVRKGIVYDRVEYFVVFKTEKKEYSKKDFNNKVKDIRRLIKNDIKNCLGIKIIETTFLSECFILLVDKENDDFIKLMNTNVWGGYRHCFLISGYSFNSKLLYMTTQKDGQYINYLHVRNRFLKVMNLKSKDRIK